MKTFVVAYGPTHAVFGHVWFEMVQSINAEDAVRQVARTSVHMRDWSEGFDVYELKESRTFSVSADLNVMEETRRS